MSTNPIRPALFKFLNDLEDNNEREWFKANKDRYDRDVKEPCLAFINEYAPHLNKISKHMVADSRPQGGSLFRIYRDTRFSKDKTPYKTYSSMSFRHEAGKDAHAPGYYLHLEPGNVYVGMGLWRPETAVARQIREAIAADSAGWKRAAHGKAFRAEFSLDGDSLKRPPAGYDADHPLIEDLKRKDFIAGKRLTQKEATSADFVATFAAACKTGAPFMRFLCKAVGLPF